MKQHIPFRLSSVLYGHDSDIKAVRGPSEDLIISASRDKTARSWFRIGATAFCENKMYLGHTSFVNSLAFLKPTAEHTKGLIVSGSSDKTINVFDPENAQDPIYSLIGHSDNVCALDVTPSGYIVSGSWDKTTKIWKNWQVADTLEGHSHAVWAVLAVDDDLIFTGSADKTIIKWQNGKRVQTLSGHTDCVRALALLPDIGFISCGNDSTLRIWTLDGQCVQELNGHTSFVYSIDVLPTGEIISSGEDRSVRVWKDGECIQTILHPATSVWCVSAMPNGDIISGASDAVIRIFTRAKERVAEQNVLKDLEEQVSNHAIPANQIGDLKKDELPGSEALLQPGKKEGQVIMIRVRDSVEAHQWSQTDQTWHKVGEVVDAVGQGRKQLYNGKEYDYLFDVDVGDGVPPLKLPYNASDNPYNAAQEFINANELSQSYLDQIADFITKNAQGVSLGTSSQYVDPFTGASRYTPSASSNVQNTFATGIDPWTRPGTSSNTQSEKAKIIPQKTYLTFRQANIQAILKKIGQINETLLANEITQNIALTTNELSTLEKLGQFLLNPLIQAGDHQSEFDVIHKIATQWPFNNRFPGIDLLRLQILYTSIPAKYVDNDGSIINLIINSAGISSLPKDNIPNKDQDTNAMLGLRALSNLFDIKEGRDVLRREASKILELLSSTWNKSSNKNYHTALVTVFLNFAVLYQTSPDEDNILQMIATLVELLKSEIDSEIIYRSLVTLGTLINQNQTAKDAAIAFDIKNIIKITSIKVKENRINQVINEITF
ncbi:WD40-repeat-containing domain protein [Glomus cerebriforme]|uniref:WD40-repeat-containing domain protein n=1 Tax=Glomus cerebriforme TaxID=658196 RepID=A0A397S005_9GLOM|nr:WD40-repeat-containing domain protein [Glomus cerebriforme]